MPDKRLFEQYVSRAEFSDLKDFRDHYKVVVPDTFNFGYDVVDALGASKPDKLAMLWVGREGQERRFTFGDMKTYSDKAANFFWSQGIRKGDMVLLVLKRHHQFWFCMTALHKIGAVAIPATHLLTTKDFVYRCNAASVSAIVCTGDHQVKEIVDEAAPECATLRLKAVTGGQKAGGDWLDFDACLEEASESWMRPTGDDATKNSDMMLLYFTSGTTGYPKMVWHDYTYPLGHIMTGVYWHRVMADGLHFTIADTGWGKAVWGKLYGQWLGETAVFTYDFDKFDAADILEKMQRHKVTTFCAPPTMFRYLIKAGIENYDLSALKHACTAGEALNPEVFHKWKEHTGLEIFEGFGQTETTVVCVTCHPYMKTRVGAMGLPSPGYRVVVVDENEEEVGAGVTGEICIRTDEAGGGKPFGLFSGYYRDDELTRKVWHDGLYHTGDTAYKDESGYLWYVGRTDDVIKSSGYRIGPFEVESALLEHPAVLEAAVTGVPDPTRGFLVKATIVLSPGYAGSDELTKELQQHVKTVTAPYKYPRLIEYVDVLPKTISGKIRRVEIRERDREKVQ